MISQVLITQSQNYVRNAPRDYPGYFRDLKLYRNNLQSLVANYEEIVASFKARRLSPRLTGRNEPLICTWDRQSLNQLDLTSIVWTNFRLGLTHALGADKKEPRLEAGAEHILVQKDNLMKASTDLANSFQRMMEGKLAEIKTLNQLVIFLSTLIAISLGLLLYFKAFRPLGKTVDGFRRVARGDLTHQIPVSADNEVGYMTSMFNQLTRRLAALFNLTDRINQSTNLDETLQFVYEEFRFFLPIDWVGLLRRSPERINFTLDRAYTALNDMPPERSSYRSSDPLLDDVLRSKQALVVHTTNDKIIPDEKELQHKLITAGIRSIIALPLSSAGTNDAVLVFGSKQYNAYRDEHLELLNNIGGQLSHSFNKSYGMESLVISAIEGLAKLAESRDPETGDHLFRMSLYSSILAEELGREGPCKELITPAFVRNVFRFSPMHDIGKVGIEDNILLKPGALDAAERARMQEHPLIGAQVLRRCEEQVNDVGYSIFQVGIEIAEGHHEKFDGSGYPYGRSGDDIPLSARIVAVADVFDALTSKRPYKEAWSLERTMNLMTEESGKHFDPKIISALKRAMPRILEIYEAHKHV